MHQQCLEAIILQSFFGCQPFIDLLMILVEAFKVLAEVLATGLQPLQNASLVLQVLLGSALQQLFFQVRRKWDW